MVYVEIKNNGDDNKVVNTLNSFKSAVVPSSYKFLVDEDALTSYQPEQIYVGEKKNFFGKVISEAKMVDKGVGQKTFNLLVGQRIEIPMRSGTHAVIVHNAKKSNDSGKILTVTIQNNKDYLISVQVGLLGEIALGYAVMQGETGTTTNNTHRPKTCACGAPIGNGAFCEYCGNAY
jgi:hypothetical protein